MRLLLLICQAILLIKAACGININYTHQILTNWKFAQQSKAFKYFYAENKNITVFPLMPIMHQNVYTDHNLLLPIGYFLNTDNNVTTNMLTNFALSQWQLSIPFIHYDNGKYMLHYFGDTIVLHGFQTNLSNNTISITHQDITLHFLKDEQHINIYQLKSYQIDQQTINIDYNIAQKIITISINKNVQPAYQLQKKGNTVILTNNLVMNPEKIKLSVINDRLTLNGSIITVQEIKFPNTSATEPREVLWLKPTTYLQKILMPISSSTIIKLLEYLSLYYCSNHFTSTPDQQLNDYTAAIPSFNTLLLTNNLSCIYSKEDNTVNETMEVEGSLRNVYRFDQLDGERYYYDKKSGLLLLNADTDHWDEYDYQAYALTKIHTDSNISYDLVYHKNLIQLKQSIDQSAEIIAKKDALDRLSLVRLTPFNDDITIHVQFSYKHHQLTHIDYIVEQKNQTQYFSEQYFYHNNQIIMIKELDNTISGFAYNEKGQLSLLYALQPESTTHNNQKPQHYQLVKLLSPTLFIADNHQTFYDMSFTNDRLTDSTITTFNQKIVRQLMSHLTANTLSQERVKPKRHLVSTKNIPLLHTIFQRNKNNQMQNSAFSQRVKAIENTLADTTVELKNAITKVQTNTMNLKITAFNALKLKRDAELFKIKSHLLKYGQTADFLEKPISSLSDRETKILSDNFKKGALDPDYPREIQSGLKNTPSSKRDIHKIASAKMEYMQDLGERSILRAHTWRDDLYGQLLYEIESGNILSDRYLQLENELKLATAQEIIVHDNANNILKAITREYGVKTADEFKEILGDRKVVFPNDIKLFSKHKNLDLFKIKEVDIEMKILGYRDHIGFKSPFQLNYTKAHIPYPDLKQSYLNTYDNYLSMQQKLKGLYRGSKKLLNQTIEDHMNPAQILPDDLADLALAHERTHPGVQDNFLSRWIKNQYGHKIIDTNYQTLRNLLKQRIQNQHPNFSHLLKDKVFNQDDIRQWLNDPFKFESDFLMNIYPQLQQALKDRLIAKYPELKTQISQLTPSKHTLRLSADELQQWENETIEILKARLPKKPAPLTYENLIQFNQETTHKIATENIDGAISASDNNAFKSVENASQSDYKTAKSTSDFDYKTAKNTASEIDSLEFRSVVSNFHQPDKITSLTIAENIAPISTKTSQVLKSESIAVKGAKIAKAAGKAADVVMMVELVDKSASLARNTRENIERDGFITGVAESWVDNQKALAHYTASFIDGITDLAWLSNPVSFWSYMLADVENPLTIKDKLPFDDPSKSHFDSNGILEEIENSGKNFINNIHYAASGNTLYEENNTENLAQAILNLKITSRCELGLATDHYYLGIKRLLQQIQAIDFSPTLVSENDIAVAALSQIALQEIYNSTLLIQDRQKALGINAVNVYELVLFNQNDTTKMSETAKLHISTLNDNIYIQMTPVKISVDYLTCQYTENAFICYCDLNVSEETY